MTCSDLELLLCEYVDGTLRGEQKSVVEQHLAGCPECAELARDSAAAVQFMERAMVVEPPAELLTRILFEAPSARAHVAASRSLWNRLRTKWFDPILQPRFAMGMAMTVLSFAMLAKFSGIEVRQLKPSDLEPAKVWMALEDKTLRTWERAVKYYESLRLVYDLQSRVKEWGDQAEEVRADKKSGKTGAQPTGAKETGR